MDVGLLGRLPSDAARLLRAANELSLARDLATVTSIVDSAAREMTGADGVTFVLRDGDECYYADEDAIAPLWKGRRFRLEACISGWVMQHGEPVVIPDITVDVRVPQEAYRPTFVKSLAMMPVRLPEPVAAIGAYWADAHTATAEELELLHRLADNAALALENLSLRRALDAERRARADAETTQLRDGDAAPPANESRFRIMADTSPLMIWVTDASGGIEYVNRAYREFFGVSEADVVGPSGWQPLVHPDDAEEYANAFFSALHDGTPFFAEARVRRADGEWRYVASYGAPRLAADGRIVGFVGSSPDITDMKNAAMRAREVARVKDEFIATLAHELRQPLHAAAAALEVLKTREGHPSREHATTVLQRQLRQMIRLVDDLLDVGRIVRGDVSLHNANVDVREVVHDAIDTVRVMIEERGHELVTDVPAAPVLVDADAQRLQQVLVNLLSNAAKYSPPRGEVRLTVERDDTHVSIRVRDKGIGILPTELPRVFDVFTRVSNSAEKGFGIGLAVARKLVEQHGGTIEARSEGLGRGSEFVVRLPMPYPQ